MNRAQRRKIKSNQESCSMVLRQYWNAKRLAESALKSGKRKDHKAAQKLVEKLLKNES